MTIKDLFKLENYLASNCCVYQHMDDCKDVSFAEAIEPTDNGIWDSYHIKVEMVIVIFTEDKRDAYNTWKGIRELIPELLYDNNVIWYQANEEIRLAVFIGEK